MKDPLFTRHGGYRKRHSFTFATLIHLGTIRFCKRFISYREDPLGKTVGQMIGAARSGRQNIIEGSERAATSRETEIKLTDVARASLAEFAHSDDALHDYWIYFHREKKAFDPWLEHEDPAVAANAMLVLIVRAMVMLDAQLKRLGADFLEEGGFRERMHRQRNAARDAVGSDS